MKDRSCERRIRAPFGIDGKKIFEGACAARCDHWHGNRLRDSCREVAIESAARAGAIDRCEQNFSRAALNGFSSPLRGVESGRVAAAARVSLPRIAFAFHV